MSWWALFYVVGVIAAIRVQDAGCFGMLLVLFTWPVFVLAALAGAGYDLLRGRRAP